MTIKKPHISSNQVLLPNASVPNLTENLGVSAAEKGSWIGSKEKTVSKTGGRVMGPRRQGKEALQGQYNGGGLLSSCSPVESTQKGSPSSGSFWGPLLPDQGPTAPLECLLVSQPKHYGHVNPLGIQ